MPFVPDSASTAGRFVPDDSAAPSSEGGRSIGQIVNDLGASALGGLVSVAKLPAMGMDRALSGQWIGPGVEALSEFESSVNDQKSEVLRKLETESQGRVKAAGQAVKDRFGDEGFLPNAARIASEFGVGALEAVKDPSLLSASLAQQAPMLGMSRIFGTGADALARGTAAVAPKLAATRVGQAAVGGAGTAGAVAGGAGMQAADIGSDAYLRLLALPDAQWQAVPGFADLAAEIGPQAAKERMASEKASEAALQAGAASVLSSALPGGASLEKALIGKAGGAGVNPLKTVGQSVRGEAIQEGVEEGYGALAANAAVKSVNPNQELVDGVGGAAGQGAALGGLMGGGATGIALARNRGGPAAAAPTPAAGTAADPTGAVDAGELLGEVATPPPAAPPAAAAAEKALLTPRPLTSLDRVQAIDAELPTMDAADPRRAELEVERRELSKTWPTTLPGASTTFSTEAGARVEAQYALIEADDLQTSHDLQLRPNPAYPKDLQPRERDRAASATQIAGIQQRLDPARLGISADAANGAPIIGADGLVESGNARSIALRRVYGANGLKADEYRAWLQGSAAQFGLTPEAVGQMRQPVLVRVRTTPVNRAEFARQANASTVAAMSPSEQARSDSNRIDAMDDLSPNEDGDFSTSRDFIRRFMARLPQTEQSGMIDAAGQLSAAGYARVRNAVLAKAYGDSPVLARMTESMDDNMRNVSRALMIAAPRVAQARGAIKDGARFDADITPHLVDAVEQLSRLKDDGTSVDDALAQAGIFGETYSPETATLLRFLADNARRPRKMAEFVTAYFDALDAAGDPRQAGIFGDTEAPSTTDLMGAARRVTNPPTEGAADAESTATDPQRRDAGKAAPAGGRTAGQPEDAPGGGRGNQGDGAARPAAANEEGGGQEWVMFGKKSGTLGIPRAKMPQVKGKHRGALINFLESRGIGHENDIVRASSLKPTQAEYSREKVDRFVESGAVGERSVLVSSDGYVLDGHHQWLGHKERREKIPVIRLGAPIRQLLDVVNEFPSVQRSEGADPVRAKVRDDFVSALGDLAQIASKHTRAAMVSENTPELLPTLVKLFEAGIKEVGYGMKDLLAYVKTSIKNDPRLKTFWNKVPNELYQKAARQAIDNVENAPAEAMIDGRAYDPKTDNFTPPHIDSFLPAAVLKQAKADVERYFTARPPVKIDPADAQRAEGLLKPLIKRAEEAKVEYDQKIIDIARRAGAIGQMLAPIKGLNRSVEKLVLDEGFNIDGMKDMLRSTVVVRSYADAQKVVEEIEREFKLLRDPKNRTGDTPLRSRGKDIAPEDPAKYGGYSDVLVNVVMPNGVIAEIQINVPEMLGAKEGPDRQAPGHKLYEAYREAPKESPLGQEILGKMLGYYAAAGEAARKAAASARKSDSERSYHSPVGPRESSPGRADKLDPPASSANQSPPGNSTKNPPSERSPNLQPDGNLPGTSIASSPASSVPELPEKGYTVNTAGDRNATPDRRTRPEGSGPGAARVAGEGRRAAAVPGRAGQPDLFGSGEPDAGAAPAGEVGRPGGGGVRGADANGAVTAPRGGARRPVAVPAGRDIGVKSGRNYRFTDEDLTYAGSWAKKAAANVDAVELLKKLQAEGRQATPDEQKTLAKFIGWGSSEIANTLFGKKLDKVAVALEGYNKAKALFESTGAERIDRFTKGYYDAAGPLMASGKIRYGDAVSKSDITLAKFGLEPADVRWLELRDRLKAALTEEEWAEASRSTQYAHYTSGPIVRSMWNTMRRFGFEGGAVLEPGSGVGIFPGLMPEAMAANSAYTGIEYDSITAGILAQLFPDERILAESFVDSKLPKNFYDVAAGNPPFSGTKILGDPEYQKLALSLHDYFFAKTIDRVRPGGLVMFVTSRYTMDKLDDKARAYLAERADLVGAIRLPQTAFKQNAGTDVVTDVLFLRKKVPGETFEQAQPWGKSVPMKVGSKTFPVNEYFHAHPEMVLGTPSDTGSMQNSPEPQYTVLAPDGDIEALFAAASERMPANIYKPARGSDAEAAKVREIDVNPKAKKEGNYYVSDAGALMQREGGVGLRVDGKKPADVEVIKAMVPLRDALKQAHYDQLNGGDWETSLKALQAAYKAFTAKHGAVNQSVVKSVRVKVDELDDNGDPTGRKVDDVEDRRSYPLLEKFRDDPDWTLVAALEKVNEETGAVSPGSFLTDRVLGKPKTPQISTPHDALLSTLNDLGRIDIPLIAERLDMAADDVIAALGTAIYENPESGWETSDQYLSGNVRRKLDNARAAAKSDRKFERNVAALEAAQPAPKNPAQINAGIGMSWIPGEDYAAFLKETAGVTAKIRFNEATRQWVVSEIAGGGTARAEADWGVSSRWNATMILEHALTGAPIRVTKTIGTGKDAKTVLDPAQTELAQQKLEAFREAFGPWLWKDADRATRLVQAYNDKFNTHVARSFDGRHLTLPGASAQYNIFDHVKRGAWRIIQSGNTYLAHAVGSGKTFQMVISAMEQKRLGLINKPMIVVPNHMLQQFAREWQDLYPAARLMIADEANFHTDNRRRFVSRVALSDLDGVIITHSAFKLMDLDPDYKAKIIEEQLQFLRASLEQAEAEEGGGGRPPPRIKQIEKQIENMEQKLEASMSGAGKDKNVRFDELGVDMLYVDEAHAYRKLDFGTSRQVKGIQPAGSARALDLYIKARYLDDKNPGRSLVMASGTPITNTVAELYTIQRFLGRQVLKEKGIEDFDSWAAMFGRERTALEPNAAGKYEPVTRFNKFVNVPELTAMFRDFADVVTADQLAQMLGDKRPRVDGGSRNMVVTPKTQGYAKYQKELEQRVTASKNWKPSRDEPNNPDPMIKIIGDGRLAAIDMRFVNPSAPSDPDSKLNKLIDDVIRTFKASADTVYNGKDGKPEPIKGSTMMVFSDLGFGAGVAANRGFNARAWFEKRLRDAGVPPGQVAFMQDFKKSTDKLKLFRDVNAGRVRLLVGSSGNMGTGVNAQQRLLSLFHLDSPWFPADLEQREGRIVRQGNKNPLVQLGAYAAKGTYDENMWKGLANKQYFIDLALSGDENVREIEDLDSMSQFDMAAALVAEDPRVLQLAGAQAEIGKLNRLYQAHEEQRQKFRNEFKWARDMIDWNEQRLPEAEKLAGQVPDLSGENFRAKVGRSTFDKRAEWGEALLAKWKDLSAKMEPSQTIGEIAGFPVRFVGVKTDSSYRSQVMLGTTEPVQLISQGNESEIGIATRAVNATVEVARVPGRMRELIAGARAKMDALRPRLESAFPMAQLLADKVKEVAAIEAQLAAEGKQKQDPAREDDGETAPEPGQPFIVYRVGTEEGLANANGGNAQGVAAFLAAGDDPFNPTVLARGQRLMQYRVTIDQPFGTYATVNAGRGASASVGRMVKWGGAQYSFPETGFKAELIASAPMTAVRDALKAKGFDDFDEAGSKLGAEVLRAAVGASVAAAEPEPTYGGKTLQQDLDAQEKWLTTEARSRGFPSLDDFVALSYDAFERLASKWRKDHPLDGTSVAQRKARYANNAQGDLFQQQLDLFLDSRPVESQAGAGVEKARRAATDALSVLRGSGTLLGRALAGGLAARQKASLVGQVAKKPEDLAMLAQVYRDPRFETFRVFFTDARGKIVSQVGLTNRLPGSTSVMVGNDLKAYVRELSSRAIAEGAKGAWLLHNHPSGNATPSRADESVTMMMGADFKVAGLKFHGHVVIDTNHFSFMNERGDMSRQDIDAGGLEPFAGAGEYAGQFLSSPEDVMKLAKRLQVEPGAVTLISLSHQHRVHGITTIPASVFEVPPRTTADERRDWVRRVKRVIQRAVLSSASSKVVAIGRDRLVMDRLQTFGLSLDAIHVDDQGSVTSMADRLGVSSSEVMPATRRVRVTDDTSPAFAYLRQAAAKTPVRQAFAAEDAVQYGAAPVQAQASVDARADAIIAKPAGTARPLDAAMRMLTRATGIERAGAMLYGTGAKLLDRLVPETVKAGIVSDYGVPEAVIDQRAMLQGRMREKLRGAGDLLEKLSTLTRAESRVAYEWMNMDGSDPKAYVSMMQGLPEESVKVLQEVQQLVDKMSQEAVRLGQLDPEDFKRHRFAYLRRSYVKHTAELKPGDKAKRQRAISILGDQYRGRGMVAKAPMRQIQNAAPEWWQRKFVPGKADTSLKGAKFIRFERREPIGAGTLPLAGVGGKQQRARLREVQYWPADEKVPARFADWDNAGTWEVRGTKADDLVMWRDFTKDERESMGEIDEARFAIAKTLHRMIHDTEVGRYLEWISQNHSQADKDQLDGSVVEAGEMFHHVFRPGEWVQVPSTKIAGTDVEKYGKLAGRYVPGPVWNDLRQVVGGQFMPLGETYHMLQSMWKTAKTALSPGVHTNNVMSNFVMADWHDVSAGHVAKALRIVLAASKRDGKGLLGRTGNFASATIGAKDAEASRAILARYQDSGGSIGSWVTQEIASDQMESIVAALERELATTAAASAPAEIGVYSALQHLLHARFRPAWEAFRASKPATAVATEGKSLIDLYQAEDDVFRLAAWLKAKEEGKSDPDAGKTSRRSFLDYSINAPWIAGLRGTILPFVAFTYRAVPMLIETAAKKPHKIIKLMALAGALDMLGVMLGGGGDDDDRRLLPEEKAGRIWGMVPKLIRMPWNDAHGSPVYLDIRRWIPVGDVADIGQGHSALPLPPAMTPGGPLAVLGEVLFNHSIFTGKSITLETDTLLEKSKKVADHLWKAASPNVVVIPGTYANQGVMDAARGRTDSFGREMSMGQALASTVGVKVGGYPADVLRRNLNAKTEGEIMEIDREIAALRRQRITNRIDQDDYEAKVAVQRAKQAKIRQERREKVGG